MFAFDNVEEAFEFMRQREAEAITTDSQKAITWGDYFWRVEVMGPNELLAIFTYCLPLEEIMRQEADLGADEEEVEGETEMLLYAHERGYRYGQHHSIIEPEGEWGCCHVSTIASKLTKAQFEAARAVGWDPILWKPKGN